MLIVETFILFHFSSEKNAFHRNCLFYALRVTDNILKQHAVPFGKCQLSASAVWASPWFIVDAILGTLIHDHFPLVFFKDKQFE